MITVKAAGSVSAAWIALLPVLALCGHPALAAPPGAAGSVRNVELSANGSGLAASVPKIAVDPRDPQRLAVIWRYVSTAPFGSQPQSPQSWICHLSLSTDGGRHFADQTLDWRRPRTPRCNAPYVFYASNGDLYVGATLMGAGTAAHGRVPPFGRVVIRRSVDGGRTWSDTESVIATDSQSRFAANPAIPAAARLVPWDGASGVIDRQTGDIFASGGYPAPPGGAAHSQRFFAGSSDRGATWGPIRAFGGVGWPQRWDGDMAAAHGTFAVSYIADGAAGSHAPCPCVVFGTSRDGGRTLHRHYVTSVTNIDTLVHYPPLAADPVRKGAYSFALVSDDARQVSVWTTADDGNHWTTATLLQTADLVKVSRPALAYTSNGMLVVMWRGAHADGSFDVYVAAARQDLRFGGAVRLSTAPSHIPPALLSNYAVRGDFIDSVTAAAGRIYAAWTDWRTGAEGRVYFGSVPLGTVLAARR